MSTDSPLKAATVRRLAAATAIVLCIAVGGCSDAKAPASGLGKTVTLSGEPLQLPAGFDLAEGFEIELLAGEPLVTDPVDMEIDEHGRFYVVEMPGYPLDVSGTGTVKLLTDSNGDGRLDTSTVFAAGLTLPTGVTRWKNGILVVDAPSVLYFEDTDGDGVSDKREVMLSGFALSNPQHNVNNPEYGLDNWIYLGHEGTVTARLYDKEFGDKGTAVHFANTPDSPQLPVNANGRSVRFRPDTRQLESLSGSTQFGHTFTAWGQRLTVNNSHHVMQEAISARYLNRNPHLAVTGITPSLSDHGDPSKVFPVTTNPEHQAFTDVGVITSASGLTAYLGGAFGAEFDNATFVAESVGNLVHADTLVDGGGTTFVAKRMYERREFLASTDAWFRPVNLYVGPEGGLYVVDYYRRIVEHPEWMADQTIESGTLYDGHDKGRIYRILPRGKKPERQFEGPKLGGYSTLELVDALAHENVWWRRHAQRLLVDRFSAAAMDVRSLAALTALAQDDRRPLGRLHALWTLEGMGKLPPELIVAALRDDTAGVRENAVRLAEGRLDQSAELRDALIGLQDDPQRRVRFQLLATLGFIDTAEAAQARQKLLFADVGDSWMHVAALSAPPAFNRGLLDAALARHSVDPSAYSALIQRLAAMEVAAEGEQRLLTLLQKVADARTSRGWESALMKGLASGYRNDTLAPETLPRVQSLAFTMAFDHPSVDVRSAALDLLKVMPRFDALKDAARIASSRKRAGNARESDRVRLVAIKYLALADPEGQLDIFKAVLSSAGSQPLQDGTMDALAAVESPAAAGLLLDEWMRLTPALRDKAVYQLVRTRERIIMFLDAIESGKIAPADLGLLGRVALMWWQQEVDLRERARKLLSAKGGARAEVIQAYKAALTLQGSRDAGERVYENVCSACHKLGEHKGTAFGPDLASVRNRAPASILADILDPNLSIADGHDLWSITLKDGSSVQGVIVSETTSALALRQMGGLERVISRQDIAEANKFELSSMPEGLENAIDLQQMADLLAFIRQPE